MEELVSSKWLSHSFLNNFEKLESNRIGITFRVSLLESGEVAAS